jgi:hypothetical protein
MLVVASKQRNVDKSNFLDSMFSTTYLNVETILAEVCKIFEKIGHG